MRSMDWRTCIAFSSVGPWFDREEASGSEDDASREEATWPLSATSAPPPSSFSTWTAVVCAPCPSACCPSCPEDFAPAFFLPRLNDDKDITPIVRCRAPSGLIDPSGTKPCNLRSPSVDPSLLFCVLCESAGPTVSLNRCRLCCNCGRESGVTRGRHRKWVSCLPPPLPAPALPLGLLP